ncbi:E3 ubiquitin-protein ligase RNF180-like [Cyprinodon tularosa]|uniref:E3 ubiquitin-protein ligase RNF180-like n=1 Tax=Cyprinodon tularosa TaxID=77115 RepID=UPI0018E274F6|nr:E3 ubiquitin-protein ligase RNF180-like [Cyprinodon tularosa]
MSQQKLKMDGATLRCRRCRRALLDFTCLLTAADESPAAGCSIWHIDADNLPDWILALVQQALWTAGKLSCRHCGARLGGFSFLRSFDCPCGRDASVHLSRSRVDLDQKNLLFIVQPRGAGLAGRPVDLKENAAPENALVTHLPCLPPVAPAEALDPVPAAKNLQHCAAAHTHTSQTDPSVRGPTDSQSDSDHEACRDALPSVSVIPGGSRSVELQPAEEVFLRRRSTSEGEPERAEEADRVLSSFSAWIRRSKRDKNRLKSQRRKERRRERWLQRQEEAAESSSDCPSDSGDVDRDSLTCPVCLDVFFSPHSCLPCAHVFCEPCLRRLAKNRAADTPCPLCRRLITHTSFHRELDQTAKTLFPKVWTHRRQNFHNAPCARWPLPRAKENPLFLWAGRRSVSAAWRRWRLTAGAFNVLGLPRHTFSHIDMILFIFAVKLLFCLAVFLSKFIF